MSERVPLMMRSSSLDYWRTRWASAPADFETSWPDEYARRLELLYLERRLPSAPTKILEIGCGAFGLAESPLLATSLRDRYVGVDGSPEAIAAAENRRLPGLKFLVADLTKDRLPAADFILSKRTLQNIAYAPRYRLLQMVRAYPHGLLIEDLEVARAATNYDRVRMSRHPLEVPEFNWPITPKEHDALKPCTIDPFMGWYYALTRVFPDLPPCGHQAAFEMSAAAIRGEVKEQPLRGPVVALSW